MRSKVLCWQGTLYAASADKHLAVTLFAEADLDQIWAIEKRAHQLPWKRSHFLDSLNSSHHYTVGLRLEEKWIGYAVVSCVAGEGELLLLVIDTPWQDRGVGGAFLDYICSILAGHADTLFLEVRASNDAAIALYERLEFNQVGVRPRYYPTAGGAEDALIYARTL